MAMKTTILRVVLVFSAVGWFGASAAEARPDILTEWAVPFPDSQPFKIVAAGTNVFYLDNAFEQHLGRLDTATGLFTQWPLPPGATSPSELVFRATDGVLFATNGQAGEISQFDPASQVLRRWPVAQPFDGPWSLAVDEEGRVLFRATESATGRTRIGRLDTTAGTATTWLVPEGVAAISAADMALLAGGSVVFNVYGSGNSNDVATLDTATGVFTIWPTAGEPAFAVATDGAGNVYFQETAPAIARLVPATGQLTEWATPGSLNDDLVFAAGLLFSGSIEPTGIVGLDPTRNGSNSTLIPFTSAPVAPDTVVVTAAEETIPAQQAASVPTTTEIKRRRAGAAFSSWQIPSAPRMLASAPGSIYFAPGSANEIGRLTTN
jgi:streptogramin lyase